MFLSIFSGLFDELKAIIDLLATSSFSDILVDINQISIEVGNGFAKTPATFNGEVYQILQSISDNIILPLAIMFIAIFMVKGLCTSLTNDVERQDMKIYIFFVVNVILSIFLATHAFEIIDGIFDIAQVFIQKTINLFNDDDMDIVIDISNFMEVLENLTFGESFLVWIFCFLTNIILWFVRVCSQIVIISRFIEIYMRISIAPIPFSSFFSKEFNGIGFNYLKSMIALGLQPILIMIIIAIYKGIMGSVTADITSQESVFWFLLQLLAINLALIFMLFKTNQISKNILGTN